MNRTVLILGMVVAGCGGSQSSAKTEESTALTPGLKCLDLARIARSPAKDAPAKIDVSHIVVRYAGLREAGAVTRTREEACLRAQEVRDKLLAGGDWDALYEKYSDSKDAMKGEFRSVALENLENDFGNTAFALKVDELSQVVETENGFHVIWRMK
jgi:peptidyl-prolyl cis-trans isomerase NIMA-interacting 1